MTDITTVQPMSEAEVRRQGLLRDVSATVDRSYLDQLLGPVTTDKAQRADCRILFTPLHGTGNLPVRQALTEVGYQLSVVEAQAAPDPDFSTVGYPNPEEPAVFEMALEQATTERPDVILATDPDADRLGVMTRDMNGEYPLLTGNQIGALHVDYLLSSKSHAGTMLANGAALKSIARLTCCTTASPSEDS